MVLRVGLALSFLILAGCAGRASDSASARPAPEPLPVVDLTDEFADFQSASGGLDRAARVAAFKQRFEPLIPGFYARTKVGPFDYEELIIRALDSYPQQRAGIERVSQEFQAMAGPARQEFEALFGSIDPLPPIILLHSLGEMDGGVRTLPATGRTLIFGADMIARLHLAHGVEPFVHHELFHVIHKRSFEGCAAVWCDLWSEGLAVFAAARLNPAASDAQLLLTEPQPHRAAVEAHRKQALELLLERLDSTDRNDTAALFSSGRIADFLPPRAGYYLGYLVALEAGKTHTPQQLAAMGPDQVRPLVRAIVERLAAEAR